MRMQPAAPMLPPPAVRKGVLDAGMFNPLRPFFYLLLYMAVLYIRPHEYVEPIMGQPILPALLLSAFGFWLLRVKKHFFAPQHALLPGLLIGMSASVAFSGWLGGGFKVFTDFLPVMMLFYMVATSVDSPRKLRQVFFVMTLAMTVIALHGIDQAAQGTGWTGTVPIHGRITYLGCLNDPNDLGMAMLMALPMVFHLSATTSSLLLRLGASAISGTSSSGLAKKLFHRPKRRRLYTPSMVASARMLPRELVR